MEKANGAIWRESLVFVKMEKMVSVSFASRKTQGIFVGHYDRTGAILCITKNGVVRGQSKTRQTLSDPWDATNWSGLCGTPWQMVATALKLTKKVKGVGPPLPRTSRLTVTLKVVQVVQRPHRMEERSNRTTTNLEKESERLIERTLTGKARMNAYKDRVAESERVEERNRARVERGAEDVPMELGMKSRWRIDMRSHLAWRKTT